MTKTRTNYAVRPAVAVFIIVLCLGFFIWALYPIFQLVGQWLAVIAVLLAFRYWPPMTHWVRTMPTPHRWIFGIVLACFILGHLTVRPRNYYPFIAWCIFPTPVKGDPITCRQFIATTESGQKVRLLVEQLFPSIILIDALDSLDDPDHYPPGVTDKLAAALAHKYNQLHAADPVGQVDLVVMAVKLHPSPTESRAEPSCQLLKRYDFSSAR